MSAYISRDASALPDCDEDMLGSSPGNFGVCMGKFPSIRGSTDAGVPNRVNFAIHNSLSNDNSAQYCGAREIVVKVQENFGHFPPWVVYFITRALFNLCFQGWLRAEMSDYSVNECTHSLSSCVQAVCWLKAFLQVDPSSLLSNMLAQWVFTHLFLSRLKKLRCVLYPLVSFEQRWCVLYTEANPCGGGGGDRQEKCE